MLNKIAMNFAYQLLYQLTIIILPIISIPVVSHALGAEGIGMYNFITSIVTYFILFAGLGLSNYGVREIASVQDDKIKLSKRFWELELFNLLVVLVVIITFCLFILIAPNKIYLVISGISLLATLFDITWFYQGIQNFKQITLVNMLVKIISFICIIVFIKEPSDLNNYFFIQSISILISNVLLWAFLKNKILFIKPKLKNSLLHLKPALNYFIGKISITLYTTLNKTLLGIISTVTVVGLYTNSIQLITIIVTLIGTLDMVLMPHMTKLISENSEDKMIGIMENTVDLQLFISIPLTFGLILINEKLIPWFFGDSFTYLNATVPVLAPLIIIMPLGISIVRQYLLPLNRIKQYNLSVIYAAVIGIVINLLLIPKIGIWGAILATFTSECVVTVVRVVDLKKNTNFKFKLNNIFNYFIASLVMFILTSIITRGMNSTVLTTMLQCFLGALIYFGITTIRNCNPIFNFWKNRSTNASKLG